MQRNRINLLLINVHNRSFTSLKAQPVSCDTLVSNFSRYEVEIMERRLASKNYKQFPNNDKVTSLFDLQSSLSMVPKHIKIEEQKFQYKMAKKQVRLICSFV